MFTDTNLSSIKYTRGNTCSHIWKNDIKWTGIDPMYTKIHAYNSGKNLFNNDGVPSKIVMDGAREKIMGEFKEACQDATVQVQQLEYNNSRETEGAVLENKRAARRAMNN